MDKIDTKIETPKVSSKTSTSENPIHVEPLCSNIEPEYVELSSQGFLENISEKIDNKIEDIRSSVLGLFDQETEKDRALRLLHNLENYSDLTKEDISRASLSQQDSNMFAVYLKNGEQYYFDVQTEAIVYYSNQEEQFTTATQIEKFFKKNKIDGFEKTDIDGISIVREHTRVHLKNGNSFLFNNTTGAITCLVTPSAIFLFDENGDVRVEAAGTDNNIFNLKNIQTKQYGGSQMEFKNNYAELLQDERIRQILESNFPSASEEDYQLYLTKVCNVGCGYVAIVNSIFKAFRGHEGLFKRTFGIDMYRINAAGEVQFNYEALVLEAFTYIWHDFYGIQRIEDIYGNINEKDTDGSISKKKKTGATGTNGSIYKKLIGYFRDQYQLDIDISFKSEEGKNFNAEIYNKYAKEGKQIIYNSKGYDLYNIDSTTGKRGSIASENGGSHAMFVVGYHDDELIISSWGNQYILDISNQSWGYPAVIDINI